MSNIYVQEPPTNGKVILTTSLGEIEIELWSKECPKACRNFVQLCLEKFYDGTIFHRVVQNFIAQGGDPTGSGHGGESIYGEPFRNEVHSRLRFVRRGLVATANSGNNDNESQFFFTLGACPELQNKHTIFGRVAGNTLYNMIKFNDLDIDGEERPRHPPKIISTEVINNPFPDIEPRNSTESSKDKPEDTSTKKVKGTKKLQLLSFADDEEEADESVLPQLSKLKGKSSHDLTDDLKLSKVPAVTTTTDASKTREEKGKEALSEKGSTSADVLKTEENSSEVVENDKELTSKQKLEKIKEQIRDLKREMKSTNENKDKSEAKKAKLDDDHAIPEDNDVLRDFYETQKKYETAKLTRRQKGSDREAKTLEFLKKFQSNLVEKRSTLAAEEVQDPADDDNDPSWLCHTLKFEDKAPTLARDANTKSDDWFDISDPRNAITKRRREESKKKMKERGMPSKSHLP